MRSTPSPSPIIEWCDPTTTLLGSNVSTPCFDAKSEAKWDKSKMKEGEEEETSDKRAKVGHQR